MLRVSFPPGGAIPSQVDDAQIRAIAELLLADRSLRAEIVARRARAEPGGSLAIQRAHRARGLIAILGPSRARFTLRDAPPGDAPSITIRLSR